MSENLEKIKDVIKLYIVIGTWDKYSPNLNDAMLTNHLHVI
jgi:hypothetical protein